MTDTCGRCGEPLVNGACSTCLCAKCGTNPAGPGGILCAGCKEKISAELP